MAKNLSLFPSDEPRVARAPNVRADAPLAEVVRPQEWAAFRGIEELDQSLIARLQEGKGRPPSLVLWGPPGCGKTTLAKLIGRSYRAVFVELSAVLAGVKEVRAWTIHRGWKAPQAAGVIHTDFEKGFIKAEVIGYEDFVKYGSEAACRDNGKLRIEGKEYVVKDGDVMHFRFNV
mgnify:CR=1 FL=1